MKEFSNATPRERKEYLLLRLNRLKQKRNPWLHRCDEISKFISPFSGRFNVTDHQQTRNYDLIYDNTAERSLNILVSGLATGATSPAQQWFKVNLPDPNLMLDTNIAGWCTDVEHLLQRVFQKSNTYNSLHMLYKELCLFGVGVDLVLDDDENILRHHVLTAGEYCIESNNAGIVDTLYREFQLTTLQLIEEFGYDGVPDNIQRLYDRGYLDEWHTVCHAIEPRTTRYINLKDNKNMPFASYYFLADESESKGEILREGGYKYFPALCPRWDVLTGETYGQSPANTSLPNVKQLQMECEIKSTALELITNPPIQAPAALRQEPINLSAGSISFTGGTGSEQLIKPIITGVGDINAITQDILSLKQDIKADFFVDLFLMIQNQQDDRKTAAEIYALKEEKMLVLGPVMERLQHELLSPLVEMCFLKLSERGLLPPSPENIANKPLELEFQSMLAQSQRSVDINSIDRLMSSVQALSSSMPEILDRINPDGLFDVYRNRLAVDPKIVRSLEDANSIRDARNQQAIQQAQMEQAQQAGLAYNQFMQAQRAGADASLATQQLNQVG